MEVTVHYLEKNLKPRLKNPETRGEAFKELMALKTEGREPKTLMLISFLKSRYYNYMYQAYEHIEDLRLAIDYIDEVFHIGRTHKQYPQEGHSAPGEYAQARNPPRQQRLV